VAEKSRQEAIQQRELAENRAKEAQAVLAKQQKEIEELTRRLQELQKQLEDREKANE
jgi:hypothetical protein